MSDYVYTLTRARKHHDCKMGDGRIQPGEDYYCATVGGGGLSSLKFPDRIHARCREAHKAMKEARLGNTNG